MILTIDVGNTETVLGLFSGETLERHWRLSTHPERTVDEYGLVLRALLRESGMDPSVVSGAAVASVVPPITPAVLGACEIHLGSTPVIVDAASDLPVRLDVDEPRSVGADRVANTLAASRLYGTDTIAVDLGTATTFDCITADGAFIGGVISPGVRTSGDALTRRTAKLPRVDLEPPPRVIGRRTDSMIQSGIFFGAVDAIDGIVRRIQAEWTPETLVVATGGLAKFMAPHSATIDRVEPFLTLHGLRIAHEEMR